MNVNVKCFATLADADTCDFRDARTYELDADANVGELVDRLKLPKDKVEIVFINGRRTEPNTPLSEGDRVGLFPAVGGM